MTKLNVGCGDRLAKGWLNIDFHSSDPSVVRVNLLKGLPYPEATFEAVYSSHVMEHFSRETAAYLLRESHRVLKPAGIIRVVVPDLEQSCREYLRVLDAVGNSPLARRQYEWVMLELLDQMTRTCPSGLMGSYVDRLVEAGDHEMLRYVQSRTQNTSTSRQIRKTMRERLQGITPAKAMTKLTYLYIEFVKRLLPRFLRATVIDGSRVGEKHRWMYDRYGLTILLEECGFREIKFLTAGQSDIPDFAETHLDTLSDGRPYKNISLYCEARKS